MTMPEWVAHCHSCQNNHARWEVGDTWECQICYFRIPAAHVWWWCEVKRAEERTNTQEYVQSVLF